MARRKTRAAYDVLQKAIQERNSQRLDIPQSVQSRMGELVHSAYQDAYDAYVSRHKFDGVAPTLAEFYDPESPHRREAADIRRQVVAAPANLDFLSQMGFSANGSGPEGWKDKNKIRGKFQDLYPETGAAFGEARTIGDVQGLLWRGNISGLDKLAKGAYERGNQDVAETIQNLDIGFYETLPFFNGKMGSGSVTVYGLSGAYKNQKKYTKTEADYNSEKSSTEAMTAKTGELYGASEVQFTGENRAPVSPYSGKAILFGASNSAFEMMNKRYQSGPTDFGRDRLAQRLFGTLSYQEKLNLADHMESGGSLVIQGENYGQLFEGSWVPIPERTVAPGATWFDRLAHQMDPSFGKGSPTSLSKYPTNMYAMPGEDVNGLFQRTPEGNITPRFIPSFTREPGFEQVNLTAQDVVDFGRAQALGSLNELGFPVRGFEKQLKGIRGNLSTTSHSVVESYGGADLMNDYASQLQREDKPTEIPYFRMQATYLQGGPTKETFNIKGQTITRFINRPVSISDARFYNSTYNVQNLQKVDGDNEPTRNFGTKFEPKPFNPLIDQVDRVGDLSAAQSFADDQIAYNAVVAGLHGKSGAVPELVADEILRGNMRPDLKTLIPTSENNLSQGLRKSLYPILNGTANPGTVLAREGALADTMRTLFSLNPEYARQASYVGGNPDAFAEQVAQIAAHYDINISYKFGQTGAFELDYFTLAGVHPKAAAEIARLFPSQFQQEKTAKTLLVAAQKEDEERRRESSLAADLRSVRDEYQPMRNADARFPMNAARTRGGADPEVDDLAFGGDFVYDISARREHGTPKVRALGPAGGGGGQPPNYHQHTAPVPYRLIDNSTQAGRVDRLEGTMDVAGLPQQYQGILAMNQPRGGQYATQFDSMVGMYSSQFGQGRVTYNNGVANRQIVNMRTGEQVFGNQEIELARNAIENTAHKALGAPMPLDPADAMATIKQRLYSGLKDEVDTIVKNMEQKTGNRLGSQEWGKKFNDLATDLAQNTFRTAEGIVTQANTQQSGFLPAGGVADEIKKNAVRVKGADEIQQIMRSNPEVAQAIRDTGMTPQTLASLPAGQEMILSGGGSSYLMGGNSSGFSSPRGNMMGRVGQIAYGAYMMNQLWKMGTGGIMAETQQYGQLLSGVGSLALNGSSTPIAATEAGYSAREQYVNEYVGRTNYQNFGGFMNMPYYLSGGGDAVGRAYSSMRMAGGIGMAGLAAPALIGGVGAATGIATGTGTVLGGVAAAAPWVGLGIGATLLAGTAGFEAWNYFNPDKEPMTWGRVPEEIAKNAAIKSAQNKAFDKFKSSDPKGYQAAMDKAYAATGVSQGGLNDLAMAGRVKDDFVKNLSPEQLMGNMSTQELAASGFQNFGPEVDKYMKIASDIGVFTGESKDQILGSMKSMQRRTGSLPENMVDLATAMQRAGRTSLQGVSEADTYAQGFGFIAGGADYARAMNNYWSPSLTEGQRDTMMMQSQRQSGLISQLSGYFTDVRAASRIVQKTGMTNNIQAGNAAKILSAWSGVYGAPDEGRGQFLSDVGMNATPYNAGIISNFIQEAGMAGINGGTAGYAASMMTNMSPMQAQYMQAATSGDLKGLSYASNKLGIKGNAFFDMAGRQSIETNGAAALSTYNNWSGMTGMNQMGMGAFLGTNNQAIIDAFSQGGTRGLEAMGRDISYQASMASSGIALKGIALTERHNWGSGSWNAPGAGSSWWYEDQSRAMGNTSQLADFGMQQRRMDLTSSYSAQREAIQGKQMSLSQNYSMWQLNQGQASALQQRGWTQADWQYQDTTRQLNFNWGMEDINDAIRFSSGRDRKKLLRQKDRMVQSEGLESEQIDETRDRQKQLWAQEDDRYKKNKEYQTEMAKIERQNYDLNKKQRLEFEGLDKEDFERKKKEYKESFEMQTEAQTLQRKYQYDQLQLSKESAGVSAWAAQKQKELDDAMRTSTQKWEELTGSLGMINTYDKVQPLLKALADLFTKAGSGNSAVFDALNDLLVAANKANTNNMLNLKNLIDGVGN